MREDVLIVLNEREPLKQQMAAALVEQLEARHLSHHRLKPSAQLAEIVAERRPKVLVADFLLGDEGTALDLLSNLRERDAERKVQCILWTDERSVSVAVTAMKLGARDYIELGGLKDVEKLLRSIEEAIAAAPSEEVQGARRYRTVVRASEEPIAQAAASRQSLAAAEMAIRQAARVIVLVGEAGSGRSTVAEYLHTNRRGSGAFVELELENWSGSAAEIFGDSKRSASVPLLTAASTVVLEHAEFDIEGELLDACSRESENIWSDDDRAGAPLLIVGTRDEKCASAWARLAGAKKIKIPGLAERKDDVLPLLQRFLSEARQLGSTTRLDLTTELIQSITSWPWPGNIRQLRSCMLEIMTSPIELLQQWLGISPSEGGRSGSRLSEQGVLLRALEQNKDLYERLEKPLLVPPPALQVRKVLDEVGGNIRIAASRLGVGVPQVRAALNGTKEPAASEGKK